ncbi:hypothetical protein [Nocardia brevicatena]|uniref:hypothetical protein n=1 Tax=Nocardia brevicatena TaxID=37327 RepID=UPI0003066D71|nr:hypothetical protein [Nocardia brevicatena]
MRYYQRRPPTLERYARFLDEALAADVITADDRATLAERMPIEGVAAVRARLAHTGQETS